MDNNLSNEEMFEAFKLGVKEAILELTESGDGYTGMIRTDQFMEAIRLGVKDAIWGIATNATSAPCADFYDSIKEGVEKAMEHVSLNQP